MINRYDNDGRFRDGDGWEHWERGDGVFGSGDGDGEWERRRREQRKAEYRQEVKRRCSILGFSMAGLMVLSQVVGILFGLLSYFLSSHAVMGLGGELFKLLHSDWFSVAGLNLVSYALVLPPVYWMMKRVPEVRVEKKKVRLRKFFMFLVLAFGLGYLSNMAGSALNFLLSRLLGRRVSDMIPVNSLLQDMNWATALYISVIGPVIEEFVFRWLLLNRLRPLGEKAAILFSALMFGLMHGNISQFFYATAICIVFGYIAVKTGRIVHTAVLHIIFNSFTTALAYAIASEGTFFILFYYNIILLFPVIMLGSIVAAVVLMIVNWEKTKLRNGDWPEGVEYRDFSSAMLWNPGVCVFTLLSLCMAAFFVFFA